MTSEERMEEIKKRVKGFCDDEKNQFKTVWKHLTFVAGEGKKVAEKKGADAEIVEMAGWLHDLASIQNAEWNDQHHVKGAEIAGEMLQELGLEQGKIEQVKHCILSHRGSQQIESETLEAKILRSVDAMSHFQSVAGLFGAAFFGKKLGEDEANEWVLNHLERSFKKLMPEMQERVRPKLEAVRIVLSQDV